MDIAISILMPVYNGAPFLKETLDSLVQQTFKKFEVICIDDNSTDNSLKILNEYAEKYDFIRVFTKSNGGTAAKSINFGLQYVRGEYFMYSSQDDLFSEKLLEINYLKLKETNADAVVPNTIFYYPGEDKSSGIFGLNNNYSKVLSGREAFSLSLNWEITGFVLWRTNLLSHFDYKFFDFGINSDEYTTRLLYFYSNKVVFTEENFYYRQNNPNSITKKWNPKLLDSFMTVEMLERFVKNNAGNDHSDIVKIWETFYHEIFRITSIFYKNRKALTDHDFKITENKLKEIYNDNKYKFKSVVLKSTKQNLIKIFVQQNYNALKFYHLFVNVIKK
ncbi:glycosyltransferase family 2 protein [Chryseobacterium sp. SIMBA_038]|uniref:glycosyltransferase family 2 protein n=1 Tax=Chryseobacterium sp. SIMBA_038 TaxID=3085780 RepID=UPI00397CC70B